MQLDQTVICPYCHRAANVVGGDFVYPHRPDLFAKRFHYCDNDHPPAYVGCHKLSTEPLGRLADADLRDAKRVAHKAFDPLWKSHSLTRRAAYSWLAGRLTIDEKDCHIGMFDVETCYRVVLLCEQKAVEFKL